MKNFWGVISLSFLSICVLVAIFAYALAPDNSRNANEMHLSLQSRSPGFKVKMLTIPGEEIQQSELSVFFYGPEDNS